MSDSSQPKSGISVLDQERHIASQSRVVIISNREPYTICIDGKDAYLERTPGGLVSALDPVLKKRGGVWICWEGAQKKVEESDSEGIRDDLVNWEHFELPYDIQTVALSDQEINHYYYGYANTRLWPLFHYFISPGNFRDERDWPNYKSANYKFAEVAVQATSDDDWIWVQDYHLLLVPGLIRQQAPNRKIALFCHIPFPAYEVFRILPKRNTLLKGMLGSDLIGFHTHDYADAFLDSVTHLEDTEDIYVDRNRRQIQYQGRTIQVGAFPISIDYKHLVKKASRSEMREAANKLRENYNVDIVGIGVDRLDYTKGILERLEAIRVFFEQYPEYRKHLTFIQIASPTRTEVDAYRVMKEEIDQAVGRINGALAEENWAPIHYFYRSHSLNEILPYFMMADFALITPLRDGMNLVAKEYCAAKTDNGGALILSEMTGAAFQLGTGAFMVNPFSVEGVAEKLHKVLNLDPKIKAKRMAQLRDTIARNDIHRWVENFLDAFEHAVQDRN